MDWFSAERMRFRPATAVTTVCMTDWNIEAFIDTRPTRTLTDIPCRTDSTTGYTTRWNTTVTTIVWNTGRSIALTGPFTVEGAVSVSAAADSRSGLAVE